MCMIQKRKKRLERDRRWIQVLEVRVDAERQSRHLFQEDSVDTSRLPYTRQSGVLRQDEQVAPQARDIGYTAGRRFLDSCQDADDQRADRAPDHSGNQQSEIQRPPRRSEIQRNDAGERKFLSRYWVLGFRY